MIDQILDWIVIACLVAAALFSVSAGLGLLRFTDVLSRLHAATKPQVLGLLLVIVAIALDQRSWGMFLAVLPAFLFQALLAPIAAHMVGRAAYRSAQLDDRRIILDELEPAIRTAD